MLGLWHAWGMCFKGLLLVKQGDATAGLKGLRSIFAEVPAIRSLPRYLGLLGELATILGQLREIEQAVATIDGAIERAKQREERWCLAELLRIKGELVLLADPRDAKNAAADLFLQSLELARERSALSWELRTAISLARLRHQQGATPEARQALKAVYGRFTEGFRTEDLKVASALLTALA